MSESTLATWTSAWESAQERLDIIRQELSTMALPTIQPSRVGQLDADSLDTELVQVLREPISKALGLFHSSLKSRFNDELSLLVHVVLYKFSVWDLGASYGARLQGLRYARSSVLSSTTTRSGLSAKLLVAHSVLTIVVPYLHAKLRARALSQSWPDAPSSDRRRRAWEVLVNVESFHSAFTLANFVLFLYNGRHRTITDRLLGMRLVSTQHIMQRAVSYEFMNRQMVWYAFSEFLLFLLPIINMRSLQRRMRSLTSSVTLKSVFDALPGSAARRIGSTTSKITSAASQPVGSYYLLPPNECAICAQNAAFDITRLGSASGAITATYPEVSSAPAEKAGVDASAMSDQPPSYPLNTAYMTSCGHLYCYVCLSDAMLRAKDDGGPPWECLRCAQAVTWSERAEVDVENSKGNADSMDEYEFSTEPDSESIGDSIGSSQGFTFANSEDSQ